MPFLSQELVRVSLSKNIKNSEKSIKMKPLLALLFLISHFSSWAQESTTIVVPNKTTAVSNLTPAEQASGPKCDMETVDELRDSLFSMTCWSAGSIAFDSSCKVALTTIVGSAAAAGVVFAQGAAEVERRAKLAFDSSASDLGQRLKNMKKEKIALKAEQLPKLAERRRAVALVGEDGVYWKKQDWSAEKRQTELLKRLQKIGELSKDNIFLDEVGEARAAQKLGSLAARVRFGSQVVGYVGASSVAVSGVFTAFGWAVAIYEASKLAVNSAGSCEDNNLAYLVDEKSYVDLDSNANCKPSFAFPVGSKVKAFLALSPKRQAMAMKQNPHLCAYFTEYVLRLKETNKKLLKTLHNIKFTDRPTCGDNGSVSFKIKDGDKELQYSSVIDPQSKKVSRYEVKTQNPSDMDQYSYQMQIEKGDTTISTIEFNNRLRQAQKATPNQFDALLVQDPAYFRGFQHYRRLDYWTPALSACCADKDQNACFKSLNSSIPLDTKEVVPVIPGTK